jgi:hypothetical protein
LEWKSGSFCNIHALKSCSLIRKTKIFSFALCSFLLWMPLGLYLF